MELVTAEDVTDAILRGSWVIDLRDRPSYAAAHLSGTVCVEYGERFATYVGWLVPCPDDVVLLTDSPADLESAQADLAAIGIDPVDTHLLGAADRLTGSFRRDDWAGFRTAPEPRVVVDVRDRDEYDAGHLPGALHLPVQDVETRGAALPNGRLWVHCQSGYRAGIAASLLHRMGRHVVHVDDDWDRVRDLAVPTAPGLAA